MCCLSHTPGLSLVRESLPQYFCQRCKQISYMKPDFNLDTVSNKHVIKSCNINLYLISGQCNLYFILLATAVATICPTPRIICTLVQFMGHQKHDIKPHKTFTIQHTIFNWSEMRREHILFYFKMPLLASYFLKILNSVATSLIC